MPYRSLGISVSNLSYTKSISQTNLFVDDIYSYKQKEVELAIDKIRSRFGYHSISSLRLIEDRELSKFDIKNEHTFFPTSYFRR